MSNEYGLVKVRPTLILACISLENSCKQLMNDVPYSTLFARTIPANKVLFAGAVKYYLLNCMRIIQNFGKKFQYFFNITCGGGGQTRLLFFSLLYGLGESQV